MAGIYIHIPFCRQACYYCNFHFSTSKKSLPAMISAIQREAVIRKEYINHSEIVETIYFGGGTPSICPSEDINNIIDTLIELHQVNSTAEITLEANPDDINPQKLIEWQDAGVNRLSIGIQSFVENDLKWMNRAHTVEQGFQSIQLAQQQGFKNITIDLIYGTPTLTDQQWEQNVQTAIALNIPHLSCYALTVESKTALAKMIDLNKKEKVDTEKQARQFELLMDWLKKAGYEHYEISNFAKPGYRSRHNSSYWQNKQYLGLGPSAHSFNGASRQWNISNNALYINSLEEGVVPFELENLTPTQQVNEYIMTSLRTLEGISIAEIFKRVGPEKTDNMINTAKRWILTGHIEKSNSEKFIQLTSKGKLFADRIASDLFME
jgi:oxygen-independent coproporphyrinogen-3 oxidase